jgi:hypothetical protein
VRALEAELYGILPHSPLAGKCVIVLTNAAKCGKLRGVKDVGHKITVLLSKEEFDQFSAYCDARGHKKSTLIVRLIREHLEKEGFVYQHNLPFEANQGDAKAKR